MPNNDNDTSTKAIGEDVLWAMTEGVLDTLLLDHTTGRNIFWATHDYESLGPEYGYHSEILPCLIAGERRMVVMPRVLKSREQQTDRSKDMAEVFTPSWICNAQNDLVDEAWWAEEGKTWEDYVRSTRMEITCGEAPYLASRYDTTTGDPIPLQKRIGLLDRKLRIVGEHTSSNGEWLHWARVAYHNIYGYEWQGDNLFLARKALLYTFIEYYHAMFKAAPPVEAISETADIISWNLWQMDGLRCVVPDSCHSTKEISGGLFGDREERIIPCSGCEKDDIRHHNGIYCKIRDWESGKEIRFIDLIK